MCSGLGALLLLHDLTNKLLARKGRTFQIDKNESNRLFGN
jgi:hypothetical protein